KYFEQFSPAGAGLHKLYKAAGTDDDFAEKVVTYLETHGLIREGKEVSDETMAKIAAAGSNPHSSARRTPTVRLNPSLTNPYPSTTASHKKFETEVLGDHRNRGLYQRIQQLAAADGPNPPVAGAAKLVQHLPGGSNEGRVKGLQFHIERAEYYRSKGL